MITFHYFLSNFDNFSLLFDYFWWLFMTFCSIWMTFHNFSITFDECSWLFIQFWWLFMTFCSKNIEIRGHNGSSGRKKWILDPQCWREMRRWWRARVCAQRRTRAHGCVSSGKYLTQTHPENVNTNIIKHNTNTTSTLV